ncbi:MAG: thioesterase family protein [Burkholderiaceae bacterium]|nr:thioesterase family protein [Burkholderiaceae bacterium]
MKKNTPLPAAFDDAFIQGLTEIFEQRIVFNSVLGLKITAIKPEGVAMGRLDMKPDLVGHFLTNQLHGGVICTGLDAMAGLACMAAIGGRHMDEPVAHRLARFVKLGTIDLRVDFLRRAIGTSFLLRAEVLRLGSRVASTRMEFSGADGQLLAFGSAAFMVS